MPAGKKGAHIASASQITDGTIALAKLNALTTKGDLLGYTTAHARIPVGTDGKYLVTDSTQAAGVKWGNNPIPLTTKGDIVAYDTAVARYPVGDDGKVLTAKASSSVGISWDYPAMRLVGSSTIGSATNTTTISNLALDSYAKHFRIALNIVSQDGSSTVLSMYVNGDTTASHYYYQALVGNNTTVTGERANTGRIMVYDGNQSAVGVYDLFLAPNGYARAVGTFLDSAVTTPICGSWSWVKSDATVASITSITFATSTASGLGANSTIRVYEVS